MNDLVQLMTRTLNMDSKENHDQSAVPVPESQFRLNRKYRDTLILHGKASEEPDEFHFQEISSGLLYAGKSYLQISFPRIPFKYRNMHDSIVF